MPVRQEERAQLALVAAQVLVAQGIIAVPESVMPAVIITTIVRAVPWVLVRLFPLATTLLAAPRLLGPDKLNASLDIIVLRA